MWKKLYDEAVRVQNDRTVSPFIEAGGVALLFLPSKATFMLVCV